MVELSLNLTKTVNSDTECAIGSIGKFIKAKNTTDSDPQINFCLNSFQ